MRDEDAIDLPEGDFRRLRRYLAPWVFADDYEGDTWPDPTDLIGKESWDTIMALPTDVALRSSSYDGTLVTRLQESHSAWVFSWRPDPSRPHSSLLVSPRTSLTSPAAMDQVTGWAGWGWNGWPGVAAIGTVVAAVAALLALLYFRRQAAVMTKQLQDARKEQGRQQKQRLEEAQMAVTPLVSLQGGAVTVAQAVNQAYDVKVTANADGAGFVHNLILNLMSGEAGSQHVATAVVEYLRAGERREVVFTSAANLLPLVGPGPAPHVSLIEVHGLFFNPWGQQIKFKHAGRIDLETDTLSFTAPPTYEWPWKTLVAPPAAG